EVEPGIGVHPVAAQVVIDAAMQFVGSRAGDELDLHAALARHVGRLRGGGDRDLFDGVEAGADAGEHAVPGLGVIVLDVHAVEGDVDGAGGEAVDHGAAGGAVGGGHAGHEGDEVEGGAAGQRQAADLRL